jgi:hypothetical protein
MSGAAITGYSTVTKMLVKTPAAELPPARSVTSGSGRPVYEIYRAAAATAVSPCERQISTGRAASRFLVENFNNAPYGKGIATRLEVAVMCCKRHCRRFGSGTREATQDNQPTVTVQFWAWTVIQDRDDRAIAAPNNPSSFEFFRRPVFGFDKGILVPQPNASLSIRRRFDYRAGHVLRGFNRLEYEWQSRVLAWAEWCHSKAATNRHFGSRVHHGRTKYKTVLGQLKFELGGCGYGRLHLFYAVNVIPQKNPNVLDRSIVPKGHRPSFADFVAVRATQIQASRYSWVHLLTRQPLKGIEKGTFVCRKKRSDVTLEEIGQALKNRSIEDRPSIFKIAPQGRFTNSDPFSEFGTRCARSALAQQFFNTKLDFTRHV